MARRILTVLAYLLPCALLFVVHYNALRTWFFMDDFAWLGLRMELHSPRDLWMILFEPRAQGTVRTLSERLFFLVFSSLFGMKAGPFHYWVFFTQCGSLMLTVAIVKRLSGSFFAGVAAACAWSISPAIAVSMAWLSAYNEVLCGFLLLSAFYCLMRFVETGGRRFWTLQWLFYLPAFFALEAAVAYPAVAVVYVWFAGRRHVRRALWLWLPAVAFTAVHFFLIPKQGAPYKMTFDLGIFAMLGRYAFSAAGPKDLSKFTEYQPGPLGVWVAAILLGLLAVFVAFRWFRSRDWRPLMGVVWFCCLLGPVLPLQNHFNEYYATIGSFGLAMLTGWAFQSAFASGWIVRVAAVLAAGVLVWCNVVQVDLMGKWYRNGSGQIHIVMNGLEEIAKRRPVENVLLAGIDDETFISGMKDDPFRLYGIPHAYLVPGGERLIRSIPRDKIAMRIDRDRANQLIAEEKTVVAAFDGHGLTDMTAVYKAMATGNVRLTLLRTNDQLWSSRLGEGWYEVESGFRWMKARATVDLDSPSNKASRVMVSVFVPRALLDPVGGKLEMRAFVDGRPVGVRPLIEGRQELIFDAVPPELFDKARLEIALEVNHVVVPPGDGRELGVAVFEIGLKAP